MSRNGLFEWANNFSWMSDQCSLNKERMPNAIKDYEIGLVDLLAAFILIEFELKNAAIIKSIQPNLELI